MLRHALSDYLFQCIGPVLYWGIQYDTDKLHFIEMLSYLTFQENVRIMKPPVSLTHFCFTGISSFWWCSSLELY